MLSPHLGFPSWLIHFSPQNHVLTHRKYLNTTHSTTPRNLFKLLKGPADQSSLELKKHTRLLISCLYLEAPRETGPFILLSILRAKAT